MLQCAKNKVALLFPVTWMFWLWDIAKKELAAWGWQQATLSTASDPLGPGETHRTPHLHKDRLEGYNLRLCRFPGCDSGL